MWRMIIVVALTLAVGAVGTIGNQVLMAQSPPVTRTMLQQKDLEGAEGREIIMYRADFCPWRRSGKTPSSRAGGDLRPGRGADPRTGWAPDRDPQGGAHRISSLQAYPQSTERQRHGASEGAGVPGWGEGPTHHQLGEVVGRQKAFTGKQETVSAVERPHARSGRGCGMRGTRKTWSGRSSELVRPCGKVHANGLRGAALRGFGVRQRDKAALMRLRG